ncbi:MAG: hypothetical protein ABI907_10765 [Ramlibacter sp.]
MARSSIMGGERAAVQPSGKGADLLGPSDSSDSGSDATGELGPDQLNSDTDRAGTGERASADLADSGEGIDILPDRVDRLGGSRNAGERMDDDLAADSDDDSEDDA